MAAHNTSFIEAAGSAAYRPRISRETRRLLATALLAVVALWVLARLRFPDRPPAPNPVPPILEQLTERATFADLAARVAEIQDGLADSLVAGSGLRIRDDLAVALTGPATAANAGAVIAQDRASGLAVIQAETVTRAALPILWSPRDLNRPRYVLASANTRGAISLRPVFIASLTPMTLPQWDGPVWALPRDAALVAGAVLFTEQAELIGFVTAYDAGLAIVPARTLLAAAERLLEQPGKQPVDLGIEVDALTPRLAMAAGADSGVLVTWVDPSGIAARDLAAGDVIHAINDVAMTTPAQWRVYAARAGVGDALVLRVTRRGEERMVSLIAAAPAPAVASRLGLTLRTVTGVGAEVMRVDIGSAADRAGIVAGDVITSIGRFTAPSPAQVRAAFASMRHGDPGIVALRRGAVHRAVVLER